MEKYNHSSTQPVLPPLDKRNKKIFPTPVLVAIALLLCLCVGGLVYYILHLRATTPASTNTTVVDWDYEKAPVLPTESSAYTESSDVLTLREGMFGALSNIYAVSPSSKEDIINVLNAWITYPSSEASKLSLDVFAVLGLIYEGYNSTALDLADRVYTEEGANLTPADSCELSRYRKLINSLDTGVVYTDEYPDGCPAAPAKDESETDFAYAKRLFLSGYLYPAAAVFRTLDLPAGDSIDQDASFAYNVLFFYYNLTGDSEAKSAWTTKLIRTDVAEDKE